MPQEERSTIAYIASNILMSAYFVLHLRGLYADGSFAGPDGVMHWARAVLWMIPLGVLATIVLVIAVTIVAAVLDGGSGPSNIVDERDRKIRSTGMQVAMVTASVGFLVAVGFLALDYPVLTGLNIIFAAFAVGSLAGDLTKFGLYRYGA